MFSSPAWEAANRNASPLPDRTKRGLHHLHQSSMIASGCLYVLKCMVRLASVQWKRRLSGKGWHGSRLNTNTDQFDALSNICFTMCTHSQAQPGSQQLGATVCAPSTLLCGGSGRSLAWRPLRSACSYAPMPDHIHAAAPDKPRVSCGFRAKERASRARSHPFGPVCCSNPIPAPTDIWADENSLGGSAEPHLRRRCRHHGVRANAPPPTHRKNISPPGSSGP